MIAKILLAIALIILFTSKETDNLLAVAIILFLIFASGKGEKNE